MEKTRQILGVVVKSMNIVHLFYELSDYVHLCKDDLLYSCNTFIVGCLRGKTEVVALVCRRCQGQSHFFL
jgi:hypothetical protein